MGFGLADFGRHVKPVHSRSKGFLPLFQTLCLLSYAPLYEDDGLGIEQGEDADIEKITYGNLMKHLYFDLALANLDDKYCS